jgi:hypothetical protein
VADALLSFSLVQEDVLVGAFLYYFVGLAISRMGSVIVQPFLAWIGFLRFSSYGDYVSASKLDSKIDQLSEINNMYRTVCSLLFTLSAVYLLLWLRDLVGLSDGASMLVVVLGLLLLFLLSYRKQTGYVVKRVQKALESN